MIWSIDQLTVMMLIDPLGRPKVKAGNGHYFYN